jgi:hypothetical protein
MEYEPIVICWSSRILHMRSKFYFHYSCINTDTTSDSAHKYIGYIRCGCLSYLDNELYS